MVTLYRPYTKAKYCTFSVSVEIPLAKETKDYAVKKESNISVITRRALREYLDREYEKDRQNSEPTQENNQPQFNGFNPLETQAFEQQSE